MVIETPVGTIAAGAAGLGNLPDQGTPASARPEDVAIFEAALNAPPTTITQTAAIQAGGPVGAIEGTQAATPTSAMMLVPPETPQAATPLTLGQDILNSLNSVRGQFDTAAADIRGMLEGSSGTLTVGDMLSVQMQISTFTVQQDLMGKIVGKATQNVDQLLKAQ